MAENDMTLGYLMGSDNSKENCNNGGFGNGWGDFIWVILILAIFGYGGFGGGYGAQRGGFGGGAMDGYVLTSDFANIERKIDNVFNGQCQSGYNAAQLANGIQMQVANGFSGLSTDLCQLGNNVAQQFNAQTIAQLQGQNAIATQIADCCCTNRYDALQNSNAVQGAIRDGFCQTNYNAQSNTRDIIEANAANTRMILDKLTAQEIAAKDATIAAQNQRLFAAELAASHANQTADIRAQVIGDLQRCPVGTYSVPNPNCCYGPWGAMNWTGFTAQQNSGCGCGC